MKPRLTTDPLSPELPAPRDVAEILGALQVSDDWRSIIARLPPGSGKLIKQQLDAFEAAYGPQEWTLGVALVHLGKGAKARTKSPYRVRIEPRLPTIVVSDDVTDE